MRCGACGCIQWTLAWVVSGRPSGVVFQLGVWRIGWTQACKLCAHPLRPRLSAIGLPCLGAALVDAPHRNFAKGPTVYLFVLDFSARPLAFGGRIGRRARAVRTPYEWLALHPLGHTSLGSCGEGPDRPFLGISDAVRATCARRAAVPARGMGQQCAPCRDPCVPPVPVHPLRSG